MESEGASGALLSLRGGEVRVVPDNCAGREEVEGKKNSGSWEERGREGTMSVSSAYASYEII